MESTPKAGAEPGGQRFGPGRRLPPAEAARRFVELRYPDCQIALLAGSAGRGDWTEASDLDIVIFDETLAFPCRRTHAWFGWTIEAFSLTRAGLAYFLESVADSGLPTMLRMCMEGVPIRDDGHAADIRRAACDAYEAGPPAWTRAELDQARYELTECLLDLESAGSRPERLFVAAKLVRAAAELRLRGERRWIGDGKWLFRALRASDPALAGELTAALERFYRDDDAGGLLALVRAAVLGPVGGPLAAGYAEGC